ncbi:hypothetical protein ACN47E_003370 [Coniothyrium glycines]
MVSSSATARRPGNMAICAIFAMLSALGLYTMRISTAMNDVPLDFLDVVSRGIMPNGVLIKKHYTGLKSLDEGLSFLVAAFLSGSAKWNEAFYWQQLHFLLQITPLIAVMTVEACRVRNQSSWLKYTTIWAILYQNVGAAVIVSIWWMLFHRISADKSYFARGREVPLIYVRLILPSTILLYFVPTLAIFFPSIDISTLQSVLAFWQLCPIFVNIPLWVAAAFHSAKSPGTAARNADLSHLKALYAFGFIVSVATHWYTVYGVSTSTDPTVTFASVFMPSAQKWKLSFADGLLWIFQWDWIICGLGYVIPSIIAVCDVQRLRYGKVGSGQVLLAVISAVALSLLGGPGAAISATWFWREPKLALLEQKLAGLKKRL